MLLALLTFAAATALACDETKPSTPRERAAVALDAAPLPVPATAPTATGRPDVQVVVKDSTFRPLAGARADFGVMDGAAYRIEIPTNWNGGLVMYAHGYRGEGPEVSVSNPEPREHLIRRGYAWAASSYTTNGYRPDAGVADTLALREHFIRTYGQPRTTILMGTSMGGHVLAASLELHPDTYQGGLALCGALTGVGQIDFLAAYGAAAEFISGVELFGTTDADSFVRRVFNEWLPQIGFGQTPTEKGRAFQSAVMYLMGGDLPYWREGLAARMTQIVNLVLLAGPNRDVNPASRAADTRGVRYRVDPGLAISSEELNQGARRFAPLPGSRTAAENPVFAELSGRIGVPVLTLHTTGDGFVPFSIEQAYRAKVDAAGAGDLLVQRAVRRPNHCEFSPGEITRAFDDLVEWMERGAKPAGDNLRGGLDQLGLAWTAPMRGDDPAR